MSASSPRSGFSLTEVVVALLLAATAVLALETTLVAAQRLRRGATVEGALSRAAREHLELVAARPCGRDTSGARSTSWGQHRWSATSIAGGYRLVDSVLPPLHDHAVGYSTVLGCAP
jgi:prepilin-type N-terminal cleavage/methylation domain-containing protein